jgi:putative membrane protein insertion efficiency factor
LIALLFWIFIFSSAVYSSDLSPSWQPWEVEEEQLSVRVEEAGQPLLNSKSLKTSPTYIFRFLPLFMIRTYQIIISPQQGQVCNFSPSCSSYGYEAIKKYGPLSGILMTSDRLQRCHYCAYGEYHLSPGDKFYDPVQNHCLWKGLDNLEHGYYEKDILLELPSF